MQILSKLFVIVQQILDYVDFASIFVSFVSS
jgi:hypothetical protein